jgi:hypothetical protein
MEVSGQLRIPSVSSRVRLRAGLDFTDKRKPLASTGNTVHIPTELSRLFYFIYIQSSYKYEQKMALVNGRGRRA